MPLSFATRSGCTPISYMASMMRSEIALCPQPAQSVVLPPLYSMTVKPMRLVFGAGACGGGVVVVAILFALHSHKFIGDRARVERQAVNMGDAAHTRDEHWIKVQFKQAEHLRVTVLLDEIDAVVLLHKVVDFPRERIRLQP